jgi:hypothetical protein
VRGRLVGWPVGGGEQLQCVRAAPGASFIAANFCKRRLSRAGRRTRDPVEGGGDGEGREVAAEHLDGEGAGRRRQGCTDGEEEGAAAAGDGCSSHCSPGEEAVELPAALVGGAGEARCSRGAEAAEPVAGDGGGCGAMLEGERGGEGRVVGEVARRAGRRRQDPGDIQRLPGEFLKNRVGRAVRQSNQFRVSTHARTLFVVSRSHLTLSCHAPQARKALCALRGLVKLQALVRGQLVRRQADATLRRMQALVSAAQSRLRVQAQQRVSDRHDLPLPTAAQRRSPQHPRRRSSYVRAPPVNLRRPSSCNSIS